MRLLYQLLNVVTALIIIDAVSSWFVRPDEFPRSLTAPIFDPVYTPLRHVVGPEVLGGLDLSPLVLLIVVQIVQSQLRRRMAARRP